MRSLLPASPQGLCLTPCSDLPFAKPMGGIIGGCRQRKPEQKAVQRGKDKNGLSFT